MAQFLEQVWASGQYLLSHSTPVKQLSYPLTEWVHLQLESIVTLACLSWHPDLVHSFQGKGIWNSCFWVPAFWQTVIQIKVKATRQNIFIGFIINRSIKIATFTPYSTAPYKSRHSDEKTHEGVEQKDWVKTQSLSLTLHQILEEPFVVLEDKDQGSNSQEQIEEEPVQDQVHEEYHDREYHYGSWAVYNQA